MSTKLIAFALLNFLSVGESRFPLAPACGFFDLLPLATGHCNETLEGTRTWKELHDAEKEKQTKPIYIDHSRAVDLCLHTDKLSRDLKDSFNLKYIPLRVDIDERNLKHPVHGCILWKFSTCGKLKLN